MSEAKSTGKQCRRLYYPNQPKRRYRCPALIAEGKRSDSQFCSPTCKRAAREGRMKGWLPPLEAVA